MEQQILKSSDDFQALLDYLQQKQIRKLFLVCDQSIKLLSLDHFFTMLPEKYQIQVERFSDFHPNPLYESVVAGVEAFRCFQGELIVAVGGGSAMDVAKCIKLYSNMDPSKNYLEQEIVPNEIPFLAIPTTAGTGSEATRYAVIYYQGNKQSINHVSCIPSAVLFAPSLLKTLPEYQKKATMMDALCHSIESGWSVNSTDQSMEYSLKAIRNIIANMEPYLNGDEQAAAAMLSAANLAGKAIDITQTTAGHAMSYKLTSLYGLAHGHSAALCLPHLWRYMIGHMELCVDGRGADYVKGEFQKLAEAMGCSSAEEAADYISDLLGKLRLGPPSSWTQEEIDLLSKSVNPVRLKNNPVALTEEALRELYQHILAGN